MGLRPRAARPRSRAPAAACRARAHGGPGTRTSRGTSRWCPRGAAGKAARPDRRPSPRDAASPRCPCRRNRASPAAHTPRLPRAGCGCSRPRAARDGRAGRPAPSREPPAPRPQPPGRGRRTDQWTWPAIGRVSCMALWYRRRQGVAPKPPGRRRRPPRYPADGRYRAQKAPPRMGRVSARMRRSTWRRPSLRALLSVVRSCSPVLLVACLLGIATAAAPAADTPPDPVGGAPAPPTAAPPPEPAMITPNQEVLNEIIVETTEPQFVAPTRRDRIGRIWAPGLIDGKGPYRLVLDTGANRSAIPAHTAQLMGVLPSG